MAVYSITSSARARREGGIVRPISLAAFRLMTSSNRVGCLDGQLGRFASFEDFRDIVGRYQHHLRIEGTVGHTARLGHPINTDEVFGTLRRR